MKVLQPTAPAVGGGGSYGTDNLGTNAATAHDDINLSLLLRFTTADGKYRNEQHMKFLPIGVVAAMNPTCTDYGTPLTAYLAGVKAKCQIVSKQKPWANPGTMAAFDMIVRSIVHSASQNG